MTMKEKESKEPGQHVGPIEGVHSIKQARSVAKRSLRKRLLGTLELGSSANAASYARLT